MSNQVRTPRGAALAELARRQHGVVSTAQMTDLGFPKATISSAVVGGRLHPIHRGVYAVGHMAITWEGRCLAAGLARPGSVASHKTAAWIYGLLRTRPGTIHLTTSTRQRAKRDFVVHFARLGADDWTTIDGIPVTSAA